MLLSIDPAYSKNTGWAYFDNGKLVEYGKLTSRNASDTDVRFKMIERATHLVIEDQHMKLNVQVLKQNTLSRAWWQIPAHDIFKIGVTVMKTSLWQSRMDRNWKVGKKAKQNYAAYEDYIRRRWGISGELTKDMIAAICMGTVYLDMNKIESR